MGKPDRNPFFFGLCQLILLLALVHGGRANARYNWMFFIPIFILSIYSAFFCATGSTFIDYAVIQCFLNLIPTSSDYILLRNRQPELRKIGQKKPTSPMTFKERLMWALSLLATPRGIGWAHEPTDQLPPRPTASRRKFIASQFLWVIFYAVLARVVGIPVRGHPSLTKGGPSMAAFGWRQRTMVWAIIVSAYCSISGVYAIASIITVAVGLCEPRDWPHIFGSPLNAYTLRKCWGRVWHQLFRKIFTSHSNFLASALHLPKGTFTTYFKLFTAFLISGFLHAFGERLFFQNIPEDATVQFFVLQAVAITFEDAVIAIGSRLGYKESKAFKLIGFIWVFAWFTFSIPMWMDCQIHSGKLYQDAGSSSSIQFPKSFDELREIFKTAM